MKVVGITMRELNHCPAQNSADVVDAISQDFIRLFHNLDINFVALPNSGKKTIELVKKFKLDAVVFSGGGDIGKQPQRDVTEKLLIDYCLQVNLPLLGICRGFQFIQHYFGGEFIENVEHIAKNHEIIWVENNQKVLTNSFHKFCIKKLANNLEILAVCENDGTIEAARYEQIFGMMWHPERQNGFNNATKNILKSLFV